MARKHKRQQQFFDQQDPPLRRKKLPPLEAQTFKQQQLLNHLESKQLTFSIGPAGTGKSFVATRFACELLEDRDIEKIIVTRPMVFAEEDIGHLPGTTDEKFAPYFAPIREIMEHHLGSSHVENLIKNKKIEIAPIGFLRGHTFRDCFVLFDEAQNTTPKQMKLFLTRIGEGSRICVDGDTDQMDIEGPSGLNDAVRRFQNLDEVGVTKFSIEDNVRSGLAKKILYGYK
jgi:phosphate starvation-inducible PhoH-like protein